MSRHQARVAADALLGSVTSPQYRNYTPTASQSVNLVSEELVAGHRPGGRMSSVRRFFCLYVTFDLLLTSLVWLICVMMKGETIKQIFQREIVNYNIKVSLVDIVFVAQLRFILLLLFYAMLYINNWSVIALSTGGTCAFLIGKVFLYDWPDAPQPVYQVFLIVASFTLAWGEAWFLDFRVLPQELHAKCILDAIAGSHSERSPLLPAAARVGVPATLGESTGNWFSPVDSPASSPGGAGGPRGPGGGGGRQLILTQEQIEDYKTKAEEGMQDAWRVINMADWRQEKRGSVRGDVVESMQTARFGKVYKFTGLVECPAEFLYDEFKNNISRLPEWNPTILRSELIKEISDGVDLSYQVTAGGGRGIIAPRDFVILRRTARLHRDGRVCSEDETPYCYMSSGTSVDVPGYPPHKDMVRGHNKVGCWCLKPTAVKTSAGRLEQKTVFQWLMCCDLKGKIPQFVLDTAFATVMLDYIVHVRRHAADARSKRLF